MHLLPAWLTRFDVCPVCPPPRRQERARAVTTVFGGLDVGSAVGLLLCGPLIRWFGWQSVFYLFAVLGFVWCLLWPLCRPEEKDKDLPFRMLWKQQQKDAGEGCRHPANGHCPWCQRWHSNALRVAWWVVGRWGLPMRGCLRAAPGCAVCMHAGEGGRAYALAGLAEIGTWEAEVHNRNRPQAVVLVLAGSGWQGL
jgi:MFS family permease